MRWGLSAKKREDPSYFRGSHSHRPARAAEPGQTADPYPAPAPCRTQGVRGAADTPPVAHERDNMKKIHFDCEKLKGEKKRMAERESASHNLLLSSTLRYKALYFKMLFSNLAFVLQVFQLIEKGTFRYFQVLKRHSLAPN